MMYPVSDRNYEVFNGPGGAHVKMWTRGVPVERAALDQLERVARLPFIHKHVAVMPDVHWGMGATIGSVIPTEDVIIPAAVGVDLGCGMMALRTNLTSANLPDNLAGVRTAIEAVVPHGRTHSGGPGDKGAWPLDAIPGDIAAAWHVVEAAAMHGNYYHLCEKHPKLAGCNTVRHMGTLGGGNHFVELCLDQDDRVWVMLHSGSRGVGNRIGQYFIRLAKREMKRWYVNLEDTDLSYLPEGSQYFDDYVASVHWAQQFARANRQTMMNRTVDALFGELFGEAHPEERSYECETAINCHHNYVNKERHYGANVWVTRKGAVSARKDEMGIIPGSMGAKSFIVKGKGSRESFHSCSHGAGRVMSRRQAKEQFTIEDHKRATAGVECRKDIGVLDETPGAYKSIDAVMAAQTDLVEVLHTLRQVVCVKG